MGEREIELARLLDVSDVKPPRLRVASLPQGAQDHLFQLYRELGGVLDSLPSYTTGGWDIVLTDGRVVELDEEQHFNRYRAVSLQQEAKPEFPWRAQYLDYSRHYENDCLRAASRTGFWSKLNAERMFGPSGPRGVLEGAGSPRWKQRALYDATKDIAALYGVVRLARLSVWDNVDGVPLETVLTGRAEVDKQTLMKLVDERTMVAKGPDDMDSYVLWHEGEERTPSATWVNMKASGEMHVGVRNYSAAEHLWTAEHMADSCRKRQESLAASGHIGRDRLLSSQCTLAVLSSVAFLEARVNEIWLDAADAEPGVLPPRLTGLSQDTVDRMRKGWVSEKVSQKPILDKYRMALVCADKERMDKGVEPLQSANWLNKLRNELVHFKPKVRWIGQADPLEIMLEKKFEANPLIDPQRPWFPEKALAAGCAQWACSVAVSFADEWQARMGLTHSYREDVDSWGQFPDL